MKITGRREQMLARTAVIGKYLLMPGDITVEAMMVLSNDPTYWHNLAPREISVARARRFVRRSKK
jgi:hypothetical protein